MEIRSLDSKGRSVKGRYTLVGLFCGLILSTFAMAAVAPFTIQTFNAYGPIYAPDLEDRTALLIEALGSRRPDILCLQEVWNADHIDALTKGLQTLNPRYQVLPFPSPVPGLTHGLLTVVNHPVVSQDLYIYSINQDGLLDYLRDWLGVVKASSFVVLNQPGYGRILLVNTHTHPLSQAVRMAQIVELAQQVEAHMAGVDHIIMAGDFNFEPESLEYRYLVARLLMRDAVPAHTSCTYCQDNSYSWGGGNRRIDHVFYRSLSPTKGTLKMTSAEIDLTQQEGHYLSDHYGIRVVFNLASHQYQPSLRLDAKLIHEVVMLFQSQGEAYQNAINQVVTLGSKG